MPAPDDAQVWLGWRGAAGEAQAQVEGLPAPQHQVRQGGGLGRADAAGGLGRAGHRGAPHVPEVVRGQLVAQAGTDWVELVVNLCNISSFISSGLGFLSLMIQIQLAIQTSA